MQNKIASAEPTVAPPAPPPAAQPRLRGKSAAFHRPSYSALPGRPVTRDTPFEVPDALEFPAKSKNLATFFSHLFLLGIRTPQRDDIVPMSVPAIAKSAKLSVRWVYKALHHLSYYGYVYLIPAPGPDGADAAAGAGQGAPQAERVVCLRIPAPGSMPVRTYDPGADQSAPPPGNAPWSGTASPSQPADPKPQVARRNPPPEADMRVITRAAQREKWMATPDLKVLESIPRGEDATFRRVVTRLVAERFGSVEVDPRRHRMRLPISPTFFGKDVALEPHVIERAIDAAARRRFVETLEYAFQAADLDHRGLGHDAKILLRPRADREAMLYNVRRYAEARGVRVLLDGDQHADFAGYVAVAGCLHAPPGICRCALPGPRPRPRDFIESMDRHRRVYDIPDAELHKVGNPNWLDYS